MKRPRLKSPCVADRAHVNGERIAEFTFPNGSGGLISFRMMNGIPIVELFRVDEGIVCRLPDGRSCQGRAK